MADKNVIQYPAGEFVMFTSEDGMVRITCRFENEALWLSQAAIAALYQATPQAINSIFKLFMKKVSLNKKQLVRLTYKFSKKASGRTIAIRFTREIFALAADYHPSLKETTQFFQTIQNKLHFACTGHRYQVYSTPHGSYDGRLEINQPYSL